MLKITPLIALAILTACSTKKEASVPFEILVGTYTGSGSQGVYRVMMDPVTGRLTGGDLVANTPNPSYLAVSKNGQFVYAVDESDTGYVASFKREKDGQLSKTSMQPTMGSAPCFVDISSSGNTLAVANYMSGNVAFYSLDENGKIQSNPTIHQHNGKGPVIERQESAHAHCAVFDPAGKFVFVVDLGIDKIMAYPLSGGTAGPGHIALALEPGDGPRHLIFDPSGSKAYVINELSNSVLLLKADLENGTFETIQRISTLPSDFTGKSQCADIHLSENGLFLYASNRGHNSIAIFSVAEDGRLTLLGVEPVHGDWPRNFAISPGGKFLLAANQRSGNIAVFSILPTGGLTYTGEELKIDSPVCLKFISNQ